MRPNLNHSRLRPHMHGIRRKGIDLLRARSRIYRETIRLILRSTPRLGCALAVGWVLEHGTKACRGQNMADAHIYRSSSEGVRDGVNELSRYTKIAEFDLAF